MNNKSQDKISRLQIFICSWLDSKHVARKGNTTILVKTKLHQQSQKNQTQSPNAKKKMILNQNSPKLPTSYSPPQLALFRQKYQQRFFAISKMNNSPFLLPQTSGIIYSQKSSFSLAKLA